MLLNRIVGLSNMSNIVDAYIEKRKGKKRLRLSASNDVMSSQVLRAAQIDTHIYSCQDETTLTTVLLCYLT